MTSDIFHEDEPIVSEKDKRDARIIAAIDRHEKRHEGELASDDYSTRKKKRKAKKK